MCLELLNPSRIFTSDPAVINDKLISVNKADFQQKRKHAKEVNLEINSKTCPRCGADLVKRNGKNGEFYGCTRFSNCRYTEKI